MFKKPCRCGKTEKQFKMDIGPFYISECCKMAGYDYLGNLSEETKPQEKKVEKTPPEEKKETRKQRKSKEKEETKKHNFNKLK